MNRADDIAPYRATVAAFGSVSGLYAPAVSPSGSAIIPPSTGTVVDEAKRDEPDSSFP